MDTLHVTDLALKELLCTVSLYQTYWDYRYAEVRKAYGEKAFDGNKPKDEDDEPAGMAPGKLIRPWDGDSRAFLPQLGLTHIVQTDTKSSAEEYRLPDSETTGPQMALMVDDMLNQLDRVKTNVRQAVQAQIAEATLPNTMTDEQKAHYKKMKVRYNEARANEQSELEETADTYSATFESEQVLQLEACKGPSSPSFTPHPPPLHHPLFPPSLQTLRLEVAFRQSCGPGPEFSRPCTESDEKCSFDPFDLAHKKLLEYEELGRDDLAKEMSKWLDKRTPDEAANELAFYQARTPVRRGTECYFTPDGSGSLMKRGTKKEVFKGNVLADGAVGSLSHAVSLSTHFDYLFHPNEGGGDTGNSKKAVRELAAAKLKQCQALGAPGVEGSVLETILGLLNPKGDTYFWNEAIKISTKKGKKPLYLDEKVMELLFPSYSETSPPLEAVGAVPNVLKFVVTVEGNTGDFSGPRILQFKKDVAKVAFDKDEAEENDVGKVAVDDMTPNDEKDALAVSVSIEDDEAEHDKIIKRLNDAGKGLTDKMAGIILPETRPHKIKLIAPKGGGLKLEDSDVNGETPEDPLVYFKAWWTNQKATEDVLEEKGLTSKLTVQVDMTGQQLLDAWWKQVMMLACGGPSEVGEPTKGDKDLRLPWQKKTFNEAPGKTERAEDWKKKKGNIQHEFEWNVPTCPWAATSMVPLPLKEEIPEEENNAAKKGVDEQGWQAMRKQFVKHMSRANDKDTRLADAVREAENEAKKRSTTLTEEEKAKVIKDEEAAIAKEAAANKNCNSNSESCLSTCKCLKTAKYKYDPRYHEVYKKEEEAGDSQPDTCPWHMCVETSEREQRKLEEKGEFSKQVSLDRLAMGIVYSHRYYEDNSMNSATEVDYASWTHRWADAKSYKKNPWPALTHIRNGWAYTHAQICQPLQDWADAVDARTKSDKTTCGEAKDEGMDCAGGSLYDKRNKGTACADHGDGHGNVCTSLDFADDAATCCTSLAKLKKEVVEKGLKNLKEKGFTAKELYAEGEGFTVGELKAQGFTLEELKKERFTVAELKKDFTVAELKDFTVAELKKDFTTEQLKTAGFETCQQGRAKQIALAEKEEMKTVLDGLLKDCTATDENCNGDCDMDDFFTCAELNPCTQASTSAELVKQHCCK